MPTPLAAVPRDFMAQHGRGTGASSASDQQIRVVVRFAGRLDADVLARAFRALPDRDPILGCRFVETGVLEGRWEPLSQPDAVPACDVVQASDPERAIETFLADLDVPGTGPHFRARLVRAGEGDVLCLRVDHRLADGGGTKLILYLLAELYRTLRAGGALPAPRTELRPRTIAGLTGLPSPELPPPPAVWTPPPFPFRVPTRAGRNEDAVITQRDIEPDVLARLRREARRSRATVGDLLLTALARAMQPYSRAPDEPFAIDVSCDFRAQLPPEAGDPICNLFGALFPLLRAVPGEPFSAALARTAATMAEIRAGLTLEEALRDEARFERMLRRWAQENGWPLRAPLGDATFVILSNLGVMDAERLDFGGPVVTDARVLGTVAFGQEILVCASSFRGRLTLSYGYCRSDVEPAVVEGIMDRLVLELAQPLA